MSAIFVGRLARGHWALDSCKVTLNSFEQLIWWSQKWWKLNQGWQPMHNWEHRHRHDTGANWVGLQSSDGVVVKLLACGAGGQGSIPGLTARISEIGYLLLQVAIWLSERSLNPQNNQPTNYRLTEYAGQVDLNDEPLMVVRMGAKQREDGGGLPWLRQHAVHTDRVVMELHWGPRPTLVPRIPETGLKVVCYSKKLLLVLQWMHVVWEKA